jgi:RNA polymerase sigma factor (sigma-70 family)
MVEEAVLVSSIRAGDEGAFTAVVERYQGRIFRYLVRLVGNRSTAEDLTQETFLSAYRAIRRTDSSLALGPWLYKIATNHAYMYFRKERIRRWLPFLPHRAEGETPPADAGLGERDLVRRALARLPADYAIPLVLHMVEGFKHHEVGAILGISAEAARKRVARGSELFRKAFAAEEVGSDGMP